MTEWWTYRLQDFLMFAPRTYYRLFELANAELWPLHLLALAIGAAILALLAWPRRLHGAEVACVLLVLPWLWVGWAFLWQRYAPINWAAATMAMLFALEGALLLLRAAFADTSLPVVPVWRRRVGCGLWVFALVLHPLLAPAFGRPWMQAEWFGIAPDPTVLATLGLLLMVPAARAESTPLRVLQGSTWCVPLLWCLASGATLWAMGSAEAGLMPAAAAVALATVWRSRSAAA
ncbi:MAG TPA: DUF6064 family protein [Burkholderiaceae bacterium]